MPLDRHQVLTKVYSTDCLTSTLIGILLKGFSLVFEGNIFSVKFHIFACLSLQTLTQGPLSSLTVVRGLKRNEMKYILFNKIYINLQQFQVIRENKTQGNLTT